MHKEIEDFYAHMLVCRHTSTSQGTFVKKEGEFMNFYLIRTDSDHQSERFAQAFDEIRRTVRGSAAAESFQELNGFEAFAEAARQGRLQNAALLFAAETDAGGIRNGTHALLRFLHLHADELPLAGARGGILIDGQSDLFTKDLARRIAFAANRCGCMFPGKPLVEICPDLHNFTVLSRLWQCSPEDARQISCRQLAEKLLTFAPVSLPHPKVLAIHAGNHQTSNSLSLWRMAASELQKNAKIEEISIRNGQLWDCRGCKYEACLHFGEQGDCFYGGVMTEKVYPAIVQSDVVVLICPNYNDSVSANIMAFINRLTSVFRVNDFSRKRIYALIVSGYSGGDLVAQQIIGAMNMNKNMILPPRFAMLETANAPGEILQVPRIKEKAAKFAAAVSSFPISHT